MKTKNAQIQGAVIMNSPNCLAIMAILAEMARYLNQNIAKVQLHPIDPSFAIEKIAGTSVEADGIIKN